MKSRRIIIGIDDLIRLFENYTNKTGDIPVGTKAVSLQVNPAQKGKFRIVAEHPDWKVGEAPIVINFEIKRIYSV